MSLMMERAFQSPQVMRSSSSAAREGDENCHSLFETFIFPESDEYATRDYQKNIVTKSLLRNTLVVLPTGLGKTFIAAVVMFNYLRWFPEGKVIFLAPTRPLVNQQIQACHDIVGIEETETAEMNGQVPVTKRARLWRDKRVFYCTPQTVEKDLQKEIIPREKICLVVIDEAHRAVGDYAFVTVVRQIHMTNAKVRVLALSATPGKDLFKVQSVIDNLFISNIEYKSEIDVDVRPYVFQKIMDVIECPLNLECQSLINDFNRLMAPVLGRIKSSRMFGMLPGSPKDLGSFQIVTALKNISGQFGSTHLSLNQLNSLRNDLAFLASLLHLRTLMVSHGFASAANHIKTHFEKGLKGAKAGLVRTPEWKQLMVKLETSQRKGGANPKILKLNEILSEHFTRYKEAQKKTSVIVFAQYRDSVVEIVQGISSATNLRVSPFVGQSKTKNSGVKEDDYEESENYAGDLPQFEPDQTTLSKLLGKKVKVAEAAKPQAAVSNGQSQKQQKEVVAKFRAGEIDVLVATCIGEEGLDIGSVDLIVSFDALASPVRMIQRFGRAGRKRAGKIIVLVADDKEKQMLTNGTKMSASVHKLLREQLHRLRLFSPPPEAYMFPVPNFHPIIKFEKLDIGEYRGDEVGGHSSKKARRSAAFGFDQDNDSENGAGSRQPSLDISQIKHLKERFGTSIDTLALDDDEPMEPFLPLNIAFQRSGDLIDWWRTPALSYTVYSSTRSQLMSSVASYVYFEKWRESAVVAEDEGSARLSQMSTSTDILDSAPSIRKSSTSAQLVSVASANKDREAPPSPSALRFYQEALAHDNNPLESFSGGCEAQLGLPRTPTHSISRDSCDTVDPAVPVASEDIPYTEHIGEPHSDAEGGLSQDDVPVPPNMDDVGDVISSLVPLPPTSIISEIPLLLDEMGNQNNRGSIVRAPRLQEALASEELPGGGGNYQVISTDESQTPTVRRRPIKFRLTEDPRDPSLDELRVEQPARRRRLVTDSAQSDRFSEHHKSDQELTIRRRSLVLASATGRYDEEASSGNVITKRRALIPGSQGELKQSKVQLDGNTRRIGTFTNDEEIQKMKRLKKRRNEVMRRMFDTEAQLDEGAGKSDVSSDEGDGSELDKDLEGFIDDDSQIEDSPGVIPRPMVLQDESPFELIKVGGKRLHLGEGSILHRAVQKLSRGDRFVDNDPDDPVVRWSQLTEEGPNEDDIECGSRSSSSQSSVDEILKGCVKQNIPTLGTCEAARTQKISPLILSSAMTCTEPFTKDFSKRSSSGKEQNSVFPTLSSSFPVVRDLPAQAYSEDPSAAEVMAKQVTISQDARKRIEENKRLAMLRLQEKQRRMQVTTAEENPAASVLLITSQTDQVNQTFAKTSSLVSSGSLLNMQHRPVIPSALAYESLQSVGMEVNNSQTGIVPALQTQVQRSVSTPISNGVSVHQLLPHSHQSAKPSSDSAIVLFDPNILDPAIIALDPPSVSVVTFVSSCESGSSIILPLFEAHAIVSSRICVSFVRSSDLETLDSRINKLLQRYAEVSLIFVRESMSPIRLADASARARSWGACISTFTIDQLFEAPGLLAVLAEKEVHAGRGLPFAAMNIFRDHSKWALLAFVSKARGCNALIAAAIIHHFKGCSVANMLRTLSVDLIVKTILPGLHLAQATKIVSYYKRVWKSECVPGDA